MYSMCDFWREILLISFELLLIGYLKVRQIIDMSSNDVSVKFPVSQSDQFEVL